MIQSTVKPCPNCQESIRILRRMVDALKSDPLVTKRKRVVFWLQETSSFPEGAPQREDYDTDNAHDWACRKYRAEWRATYQCVGCKRFDCPEHGNDAAL